MATASKTLKQSILDALEAEPGQKAEALARTLGKSRSEVNKALYGPLKGQVVQDRAYRWSLAGRSSNASEGDDEESGDYFASTDLARLSRYYLACLGYDETGVSTFLTSKFGDPDYFEIDSLPETSDAFAELEEARKLLGRKRSERGRYGLYFGYPTHISHIKSRRSDWEGFMVEPILLFPIEQEPGSGRLLVDLSYPIINQKPFQAFTNAERDMVMNELVQLEQELGLGEDGERPELDELAMRLQAIRPEWPWKDQIDPSVLDRDTDPITEIDEAGIYNRAVLIMAEKSPFTQGLEKELRDLGRLPANKYAETALGRWLTTVETETENEPESDGLTLLEVLPMNSEQREAVQAALTRPVTIITGPPGTGKSQVVTNLLINAAWMGKRVLFASKNNKAVDVVETRVNALGPRPVLLRVGAQAYQKRLAEFVLALLSSTTSTGEQEDYYAAKDTHDRLRAKHERISRQMREFVDARNEVDRKERLVEDARAELGAGLFASVERSHLQTAQAAYDELRSGLLRADRSKVGLWERLIWPLVRKSRLASLNRTISRVEAAFSTIGEALPSREVGEGNLHTFYEAIECVQQRISVGRQVVEYREALHELQSLSSIEDLSREAVEVQGRIAKNSDALWKLWLRLQPSKLSSYERQKLGRYTSLLKMVIEAGDDGRLSKKAYSQYSKLLREISHLLPCWAVTSLSARGRIPMEPGAFDIVVFDEASQCDIASAMPLLYRAKSVVVIGDPKQLSHISGLQRGQDQALLERHELMEEFPHWAYSHQSLFGLASSQVAGRSVVSLVDHHRSHSDIISFSNNEFYEERLRVATNYDYLKSPSRSEPGIRWVDLKGKASRPGGGGAVNAKEATAVVDTIRDLVLNKGYEGSIGVVTPFRAQANAITNEVNRDPGLVAELTKRDFLADTVHKFQGDERDVMLFSPVVSTGLPVGSLGFLRSNGNLFNVAITRARAQLIVVGDMAACASSDIGYLSRFAAYTAELSGQEQQDVEAMRSDLGERYPIVARPELVSDWERSFYVSAYQDGLRLIPQHPVEKYIVDFLMVDGDRRLAIEIDGERYHRNWTGELCRRDQIRNQRLFELGYDVMRFWVYEVRDDLEGCLRRLKDWRDNYATE